MTPNRLPRFRMPITAVLLTLALLAQAAHGQTPKPTLLQRIRQLIGLNRALSAGGSRSSTALSICLIQPTAELDDNGEARALVPISRPTILTAGPLNEVRLERGGQVVWRQRASSTAAIEGPIPWPLEPIQPGEALTLLLRPRGASGGDFARIQLVGASADAMRRHEAQISQLGRNPSAWLAAVDQALDRDQVPLAWALLFAPEDPRSKDLDALRREVIARGCGG